MPNAAELQILLWRAWTRCPPCLCQGPGWLSLYDICWTGEVALTGTFKQQWSSRTDFESQEVDAFCSRSFLHKAYAAAWYSTGRDIWSTSLACLFHLQQLSILVTSWCEMLSTFDSPPQEWPTHTMVYYTCLLHVWIKLKSVGRPGQPGPAPDLLASSCVWLSLQRYRENEQTCSMDEITWDGYELSLKVLNILKGLRSLQLVTRITQRHPDASRFCGNAVPLHDFVGSCVQSHARSLHQGKLMRPSCCTGYTLQRNNWQRLAWYQIHLSQTWRQANLVECLRDL